MEQLNVFTTVKSLKDKLSSLAVDSKVSLVPTMGALHHGHIALVEQAKQLSPIVVVSIFVNPKQFNNSEDLKLYPRNLEKDIDQLKHIDGVLIFAPDETEIYPDNYESIELDLGFMDKVMEGEFRPGHFTGVVKVVKRLFDIVAPDFALFGQKDFQQLAIIEYMTRTLKLPVEIVGCETIRESSGLASSSRNYRLSDDELKDATIIYRTMNKAKELIQFMKPDDVVIQCKGYFKQGKLELEYLTIVDPITMKEIEDWVPGSRLCIAAYCNGVRLIDNIELVSIVPVS